MTADDLYMLVTVMLALPLMIVIALALIVAWNIINPFRRRK